MPQEADSLRRSKRNKFHLDVAGMHLAHPERRRTVGGVAMGGAMADKDARRRASLSPAPVLSPHDDEKEAGGEPRQKRIRKVTQRATDYQMELESDEDYDRPHYPPPPPHSPDTPSNLHCKRCPAKYKTRTGLVKHMRLHGGPRRTFACPDCDFSTTNKKTSKHHRVAHHGDLSALDDTMDGDEEGGEEEEAEGAYDDQPPLLIHVQPHRKRPRDDAPLSAPALTPPMAPSLMRPSSGGADSVGSMSPPPQLADNRLPTAPVTKAVSRKRKQCAVCPFRTRTTARMALHSVGHNRLSGYKCPYCNFMSESAGFLKRHVVLHQPEGFAWPPVYVPAAGGKKRTIAVESRCRRDASSKTAALFGVRTADGRLRCFEDACGFVTRWRRALICHRINKHIGKRCVGVLCQECGAYCRTVGRLRTHKAVLHGKSKEEKRRDRTRADCFMHEWRGEKWSKSKKTAPVEEEAKAEEQEAMEQEAIVIVKEEQTPVVVMEEVKVKVEEAPPILDQSSSTPVLASPASAPITPAKSETSTGDESAMFRCKDCPYAVESKSRLDRHAMKHVVVSPLACPHCTFTCRNDDLLTQHLRLHLSHDQKDAPEQLVEVKQEPLSPEKVAAPALPAMPTLSAMPSLHKSASMPLLAAASSGANLASIVMPDKARKAKNEFRFMGSDGVRRERCTECPYVTKHLCDMKAHKAMHVGVRKYRCAHCTYSTKREISLRSHIALHGEGGMAMLPMQDDEQMLESPKSKVRCVSLHVRGQLIGSRSGRPSSRVYACARCPFTTGWCYRLCWHARRHAPSDARHPLRCEQCGWATAIRQRMEEHAKLHPAGGAAVDVGGDFRCKECPFACGSYAKLWHHQQRHRKPMKYVCDKCSFSAGSLQCLAEHEQVHVCASVAGGRSGGSGASSRGVSRPATPTNPIHASPFYRVLPESVSTSNRVKLECSDGRRLEIDVGAALRLMPPTGPVHAALLRMAQPQPASKQCPECPFSDLDQVVFDLHREMHTGRRRGFECNMCSFSAFSPDALHKHLSLHLPPLSPSSAAAQRRNRVMSRRRLPASSGEAIPAGADCYQCSQCAFRTMSPLNFHHHRTEHAQVMQQRLMTQIKRAAGQGEGEGWTKPRIPRAIKKSDKDLTCAKCSFRCETAVAFQRHSDMHGQGAPFECDQCDYSNHTSQVVEFHRLNHHADLPLVHRTRDAILRPGATKVEGVESTVAERVRLAGQEVQCQRCEWRGYEVEELSRHWSEQHASSSPEDAEAGLYLSMGLLPSSSILTTA